MTSYWVVINQEHLIRFAIQFNAVTRLYKQITTLFRIGIVGLVLYLFGLPLLEFAKFTPLFQLVLSYHPLLIYCVDSLSCNIMVEICILRVLVYQNVVIRKYIKLDLLPLRTCAKINIPNVFECTKFMS